MSDWQARLRTGSIDSLEALAAKFGEGEIDVEALRPAFDNFQVRLTPEVIDLIEAPGDPIWNQYVPTVQELVIEDGMIDSLGEDEDSPVPNITHRYPDRVLFLVSPVCASYCRFCTRRRKVGDPDKIPLNQYDSAFAYIRAHPEVRDVVLSGGDPMMLSDRRLEYIFQRLREIPHVEIIRIGSRITAHLPERVTPEFCEMVQKYHPIFMNTHFNHASELTPATVAALDRLSKAGLSLGNHTVLLKGVNDDAVVMKELVHALLKARVRPYYLYMADQVAGAEHFRTRVEKGLEIIRQLRGWTSGMGVPHFVIDSPGGGGKVPLLPEYVESISEHEVVFRNYEGKRYTYKQPRQPITSPEADVVPISARNESPARKAPRRATRKSAG
ncbi:MAG: KamA family radical SAM protein [Gemmatimonadetes bacterium]|nr:KamA family radical SAM protein [Gemmatimonadota bacterium]